MIKKILLIQPFSLLEKHFSHTLLPGLSFYLENFLRSKLPQLKVDLLYLPYEQKKNNITLNNYSKEEIHRFYSQMNFLVDKLEFEIDETTLICISCTFSHLYLPTKLITNYFNTFYNKTPIVVGGTHISAYEDAFNKSQSIDYLVQGEGEVSLYNLIKNNPKKQPFPIVLEKSFIEDLNDLPKLDFTSLSIKKYSGDFSNLAINLSRGCPFNCHFCMEHTLIDGINNIKKWRAYSPSRAVEEVNHMVKFGLEHNIKHYGFVDSIFGFNQTWLNTFLDKYHPIDSSSFWIETRLDILSEKILKRLKKNNFYNWYGLEHTNYKMLKIMNKTSNPKKFLNKFQEILEVHKKLDYLCQINMLLLHPGETKESLSQVFHDIEDLFINTSFNKIALNIRRFHNYPGTFIFNHMGYFTEKYGSKVHPFSMEWWLNKDLSIQKHGEYCIRPSHNLSIREAMTLWTEYYKHYNDLTINKIKENTHSLNSIQKVFMIKQENKKLKKTKEEFLNFLRNYQIEI
jgi:radical SAM superfamily enzyme YgiQ (UPF0313 family)